MQYKRNSQTFHYLDIFSISISQSRQLIKFQKSYNKVWQVLYLVNDVCRFVVKKSVAIFDFFYNEALNPSYVRLSHNFAKNAMKYFPSRIQMKDAHSLLKLFLLCLH